MIASSINGWRAIPYLVRISVAKKDAKYKCKEDPRYNGWREIWARCEIELFDSVLSKQNRNAFFAETLNYMDSLPAVRCQTKRLNVLASDSILVSSAYRYYGKKSGAVTHRVGVELILQTSI